MVEAPRVSPEEELRERAGWLIRFRWMVVLGAVFIVVVLNLLWPGVLPVSSLLGTIAALGIGNILILLYFRHLHSRGTLQQRYINLLHLQFTLDLVALTVFLHFMGGLETPLFFFYLVYVLLASTMFPRATGFGYAGLASFLYFALLIGEWSGFIPHRNLVGFADPTLFQQPVHIFATSFTLTVTAFLVAHFASRIVVRLRKRERELVEANLSCEARGQELMEANLTCETRGQELMELNAKLREVHKERSQFIRLVTHELRAPVAAIQSYLKLILKGYVPPEREREIIQKTERRALDQLALIGDLLELAKLDERKTEMKVEPLDLAEVLLGVNDMVRAQVESKGNSLKIDIAPGLPLVEVDPEHMKELWTNLISNAIKYTMPGGNVVVSLTRNDEGIVGKVQDTGIGISAEDLPRIFDQFYRTDNAKSVEAHGTGLGLPIVNRILETYGGKIWVESEVGKGSTFSFLLPRHMESPSRRSFASTQ
ncbi:MAG: Alkaline phosphatase synthesis sensor protein PhoR [Dehalococcoidia bacterium]|nr:Alkaline phosphatase synthesis sensor protein PhoR [Chloroflexota bacterium]